MSDLMIIYILILYLLFSDNKVEIISVHNLLYQLYKKRWLHRSRPDSFYLTTNTGDRAKFSQANSDLENLRLTYDLL